MVLILIIPATLALLMLAQPVVSLLFEHGKFTAEDTFWTSWALRFYLVGLVFAAIDWPLNYAFYARQDTLTPALVGILSVGAYIAVALALIEPLGMLGLVLADSVKHFGHATTMLILTRRQIGSLTDLALGRTVLKALLAGGFMVAAMVVALWGVTVLVGRSGAVADLVTVVVVGGFGLMVYLGAIGLMRVQEIDLIRDVIRRRSGLRHFD
jgi:putative peptidoglycan lipid II flippase